MDESSLLSMSDKDYMNAKQRAFFKQKLENIKEELLQNIAATSEHLQDTEEQADPADRATQEEEYALELRTRDRERKLLIKIEKTLKAIEDNDYGYCAETGEPIGLRRLLARPTATLSIEAQERHELRERQFG